MSQENLFYLEINDILFSSEILSEHFVCDLKKCKGACCEEGDRGPSVTEEEVKAIEKYYEEIKPLMPISGQEAVKLKGVSQIDKDGDLELSLVGYHGACAFAKKDDTGTWKCTIEQLIHEKAPEGLNKPISCYLYPLRPQKLKDGRTMWLYDRWDICAPACNLGGSLKMPVYKFLKDPIIKAFGEETFNKLDDLKTSGQFDEAVEAMKNADKE